MNKKPLLVAALSVMTVAGAILATSCKKENQANRPVLAGTPGTCPDSTISGVITSDIYLQSCRIYTLSGLVYVTNGAKITIEKGTRILGAVGDHQVGGTPGGGLVITRGSKIIAEGTAAEPIVFTSASATPQSGDWAGVVILGKAKTNWQTSKIVEGISDPSATYATAGDTINTDNSGILKYVRIEYPGYQLSANNEINGLTLAGVGNGTVLDYIEVYKSNDDSFEFFGGCVNASHLISVDALDDMFDTDNGYTGAITYALGLADGNRADFSQANGFESDNDADGSNNTPVTRPKYNYVTIVGVEDKTKASTQNQAPSGTGIYGRAAHLRRNTEFEITNSVFIGYRWGTSLDNQKGSPLNTVTKYQAGVDVFCNNYAEGFNIPFAYETNFSGFNALAMTVGCTSNQGFLVASGNESSLLESPFDRSFVYNFYLGAFSPAADAGAFATNSTWANTWSRF
ncbi:hypothetical protein SAMN05444266_10569 [Chitinophaga jiangningensis]|uniref:DUF5689 domain-containing protein n=1 Tax=Chitinophaga jiangningensis TaxID=1419482 RepID=A0A1M7DNN1_9BACT|nr:hypothetical protein [Chitinophaga jiangningensis]SHL81124.1 hypothetical protein SAMN05444266_10569 [Chitinophaga jiangningensis]